MGNKQKGWPFQEGYAADGKHAELVFTGYGWNDGSLTRQWHVDPKQVDLKSVSKGASITRIAAANTALTITRESCTNIGPKLT